MSGLQVSVWKRYGHDRLYVNQSDGKKVAWFDRRTGYLELLAEEQRDAVLYALAPYLPASSLPVAHKALRSHLEVQLHPARTDPAAARPRQLRLAVTCQQSRDEVVRGSDLGCLRQIGQPRRCLRR